METHDYPTGNACIKSFSPQLSFRCIPHSQGTRNPGDPQWYSYFPRHTGRPRHVVRMKALVLLLAQPTDTSWQLPPVFRGPCLALHLSAITHYPTSVEKTWLGHGPQAVSTGSDPQSMWSLEGCTLIEDNVCLHIQCKYLITASIGLLG